MTEHSERNYFKFREEQYLCDGIFEVDEMGVVQRSLAAPPLKRLVLYEPKIVYRTDSERADIYEQSELLLKMPVQRFPKD